MTSDQFFAEHMNQFVDFDHVYGAQCVDLFEFYNKECIGGSPVYGNAVDIWTTYPKALYEQIANTPDNCPVKGDVVIWGTAIGQYGHIAVCRDAGINAFNSFDQNWPLNSPCHFQAHSYVGVLGWLRPKVTPAPDLPPVPPPAPPAQTVPVAPPEPPQMVNIPTLTVTSSETPSVTVTNTETASDSITPVSQLPTTPDVVPVDTPPPQNILQEILGFIVSILKKWKRN